VRRRWAVSVSEVGGECVGGGMRVRRRWAEWGAAGGGL